MSEVKIRLQLDVADLYELLSTVEGYSKATASGKMNIYLCLRKRLGYDTVNRGVCNAEVSRSINEAIVAWKRRLRRERAGAPTVGEDGAPIHEVASVEGT